LSGAGRLISLWAVGFSASALAYTHGIAGYSGQQPGIFCNQCHQGGSTPQVTLSGPTGLDAGEQATYTLTITGGAAAGCGFDATVSGDALLQVAESGTVNAGGDIVHNTPRSFSGGSCSFIFKMTAGTTDGPVTLYAAGNSVNLDGTPNGDRAGTTTMDVNVNARKPDAGGTTDSGTPDAGSAPDAGAPPDAGSPPPDSGTVAPDAGNSGSPPDAGPGAGTPDAGSLGDSTQDLVTEAGCSAAGGTPLLLLAAAALLRFRRRSAKRASLPTQ
jgi:hypothetical protein